MWVIIAIVSVFILTGAVRLVGKMLEWRICAICAGVSLTWLWLLAARWLGYSIDPIVPAVLMGGSVVGAAYQLENKLPPRRSPLLWKTLFIPAGFMAVLYLLSGQWVGLVLAILALVVATVSFFYPDDNRGPGEDRSNKEVSELERKMDQCC